jgi:hypothetical protein
MATEKTFLVIGVSELEGVFKVRYANSVARAKVLERNGHTNVMLWELAQAERKEDAIDQLMNAIEGSDDELPEAAREAIYAEARDLGFMV